MAGDLVSVEVPPDLAYDAPATAALARRLHDQAGFSNLLVKIPCTPEGLTATEETLSACIGVNVTLLFSDAQYLPRRARRTCGRSSVGSPPGRTST